MHELSLAQSLIGQFHQSVESQLGQGSFDAMLQYAGTLDAGQALFRWRYQAAARQQADACQQQLLPLVQRLYRLDNGLPLQRQWQEAGCRLF